MQAIEFSQSSLCSEAPLKTLDTEVLVRFSVGVVFVICGCQEGNMVLRVMKALYLEPSQTYLYVYLLICVLLL